MNHNFESLEERQVASKEYFRNEFLHVTEDQVILPDGKDALRVKVHHPGGVNLIALDKDKRLILVEQFRYCLGRTMIETPAGKCEPGEDNLVTASRELEEETGFTAKNLKPLGRFAVSPGYTTEFIDNYLATDLEPVAEAVKGDDDEFLNLHFVTKNEAWEWIKSGKLIDLKAIYAVQYLTMNELW